MECQRCGLTNSEPARFCPGCGGALGGDPGRPAVDANGLDAVGATGLSASRREAAGAVGGGGTLASSDYAQLAPGGAPPLTTEPVPRPESMRPPAPEVHFAPHDSPGVDDVGGRPHLSVISQDGSMGDTYWIEGSSVDIGREAGEIRLSSDAFVSPRHVRVCARGTKFFAKDLDSLNGVYLRLRETHPLVDGDLVLMGSEVLSFNVLAHAEQGLGAASESGTEVYGSPARARHARLAERTVEGVTRNVFYVCSDETIVGREFGDVVFSGDSFMSRKHASILRDPATGAFSVRDLGSSNGTYLAIRGEAELLEGDHLRVGQHLFRFGLGA